MFLHTSFDFHSVRNKQGLFQRNVVSSQINVLSLPNCSVFSIKDKVKKKKKEQSKIYGTSDNS